MGKKSPTFFRLLLSLCFFIFLFGDFAYARDKEKDDSYATDFMADALFTDPIYLTQEGAEQQLELIIVRWGNNESDATFTLSTKQHPSFLSSIKWLNGNDIHFASGETQKKATLSFIVSPAEKDQKENLVLWVDSTDPSLVPARRTIVLPFHGPVTKKEPAVGTFLVTVCPDSDGADTPSPCEKDTPIYAGEPYTVQVEHGNGKNIVFEFRIVGPDKKEAGSHTHAKESEPPLLHIFEALTGQHTIEVRTTLKQDHAAPGLLGADTGLPEFEGNWQPVGTFEVLPSVVYFKGFVVEPFAALKQNPHIDFTGDINLEMAPSETKFSDPRVDMTVTGSWNRKNCADKQKTILEKSSSQIQIGFPGQIDLMQSLREPSEEKGIPFDLPVKIISRTAGKAQFKYCENIDEASFDVSFPGFYTPQKDPATFMADYTRSPGVFSFSENLFFDHPNPSQPFDSTDPIPYYVRGPDADLTLKVNIQLQKKNFGNAIRSGNPFFMPVAFNLAMWKEAKDRRSRFVGEPLMGYAIYGAESGEYTGPVPIALGTPPNREDQTPGSDSGAGTFSDTVEDFSPPSDKSVVVPDLIGKSAKDAKKVLIDQGFEVELLAGKPAPTPEKAFTVAQIVPEPDVSATRKKTVKMTVFVDYVPRIKIPAISGLSTGEAKKQLQDAGFEVTLKTRGNAPEPDKAFRTIGTEPSSGEEAIKGDTITLISFGPFQDQVTMPSLVGLKLSDARQKMEKLGLEGRYFDDIPAPTKEKENIITSQEPAPGEIVSPRSMIVIKHYQEYKWEGPMPDLTGLGLEQAREKVKETGIFLTQQFGLPASSSQKVGIIYKQSPPAGTRIKQWDYAEITFYGQTKNQRVSDFDCSRLPGTESFWNEPEGKPGCRCKNGYQIRKDKSGCDKIVTPVTPPVVVKKKDPGTATATIKRDNDSGTRLVLEEIIFNKSGVSNDLCGDTRTCMKTSRSASGDLIEDVYSLKKGTGSYRFKVTHESTGDILTNYAADFRFDMLPAEIRTGDILILNTTGTVQGYTKGWHLNRSFTYYIKKSGQNSYFKDTHVHISNRDLPLNNGKFEGALTKTSVTKISVPKNVKDKLVIGGKLGWDPGLFIDFVYRVVPDNTGGSSAAAKKTAPQPTSNTSNGVQYVDAPATLLTIPIYKFGAGNTFVSKKTLIQNATSNGRLRITRWKNEYGFADYHWISKVWLYYSFDDGFPSMTITLRWHELGKTMTDNNDSRELTERSCGSSLNTPQLTRDSSGRVMLKYRSLTHEAFVEISGYQILERKNIPWSPQVEQYLKQLAVNLISQVEPYAVRCR